MRNKLFILLFLLLSGHVISVSAQDEDLLENLTSLMVESDNEQGALYIQETINDLLQNPINLNTSSEQQLLDCGLFTPYQVFGISRYREELGSFFTIYEMATIPGFQKEFLKKIVPLVTFSNTDLPNNSKAGKGMILSNLYRKYPGSEAHIHSDSTTPLYPGSPFKISSRFKYNLGDKFVFGCAYEKDAGELAFSQWKPEHMTGYIRYSPGKFLKNITIGNFRLHTGMGLVHGLGFSSSSSGVQLNGLRTNFTKPFASTAEYSYYRGVITEFRIKKWNTTAYYSIKPEDISLFGIKDAAQIYDLLDAKRETGLHRTDSEQNGRDLADQHTFGFSLNRDHTHINYGISGSASVMQATEMLLDSLPFIVNATSNSRNLSAYAIGYGKKFEVFAEFALNETLSPALLTGGNFKLNPALSAYGSFRYYHPDYTGQIPGAYASGSGIANETGLNLGVLISPFDRARIHLDSDLCYMPSESYYLSTSGFKVRSKAELNYSFQNGPDITVRYTFRQWHVDEASNSPGVEIPAVKTKEQWRLHYSYAITESLKFSGRMEWTITDPDVFGFLMYQQIQMKYNNRISLTYRFLLFDIDSWANRIYCYEPGLRYSFLFPSYYGKGVRNSLVLSSKLSRWITLRFRLGHMHYAHKWETGSGNDVRDGDQQLEAEFQLQLSF